MLPARNFVTSLLCILLGAILASCGTSHSEPTLAGIDISPISPTIAVGNTQQFTKGLGKTTITVSFAQGSSSVNASPDLSVIM